jgi:hypothetical protein
VNDGHAFKMGRIKCLFRQMPGKEHHAALLSRHCTISDVTSF